MYRQWPQNERVVHAGINSVKKKARDDKKVGDAIKQKSKANENDVNNNNTNNVKYMGVLTAKKDNIPKKCKNIKAKTMKKKAKPKKKIKNSSYSSLYTDSSYSSPRPRYF